MGPWGFGQKTSNRPDNVLWLKKFRANSGREALLGQGGMLFAPEQEVTEFTSTVDFALSYRSDHGQSAAKHNTRWPQPASVALPVSKASTAPQASAAPADFTQKGGCRGLRPEQPPIVIL